jgi:hypothetical protein
MQATLFSATGRHRAHIRPDLRAPSMSDDTALAEQNGGGARGYEFQG